MDGFSPWYQRRLLWIFLLVLILIPVGAYLYANYFMKPAAPPAPPPAAKNTLEENLPIALNILKNPMVYEWRGSVEGTLTAKDDKSITITDEKGQSIIIQVDLNPNYTGTSFFTGTRFFDNKADKNLKAKVLSLEGIPLGAKLRGDFFVFLHRKNEMVGSSFMVIEQ